MLNIKGKKSHGLAFKISWLISKSHGKLALSSQYESEKSGMYDCHRLKLFLYIKKWRWPAVFVSLRALDLVL